MRLQTLHHHAGFTLLGLWWGGSGRLYCAFVWVHEAGRIHALGNNLGVSDSFSRLKADHVTSDYITYTDTASLTWVYS